MVARVDLSEPLLGLQKSSNCWLDYRVFHMLDKIYRLGKMIFRILYTRLAALW